LEVGLAEHRLLTLGGSNAVRRVESTTRLDGHPPAGWQEVATVQPPVPNEWEVLDLTPDATARFYRIRAWRP